MIGPRIRFEQHQGFPTGLFESKLTYSRPAGDLLAAIRQTRNALVTKHFLDSATQLPEVQVYLELHEKDSGIDNDLARINIDGAQAELDRRRAIATETGEKLATSLAQIGKRSKELSERVAEVERGRKLFGEEVEAAKAQAIAAINRHRTAAISEACKEIGEQAKAANAKLLAAEALLGLIDEVAIADQVGMRLRNEGQGESAASFDLVLAHAKQRQESPDVPKDENEAVA